MSLLAHVCRGSRRTVVLRPSISVSRRLLATNSPKAPEDASKPPSSSFEPPPPPPKPAWGGVLDAVSQKIRKDLAEMEQKRKAKESLDDVTGPPGAEEMNPVKKPGFLSRVDQKLQEERRILEAEEAAKRDAGRRSRITPGVQKKMDEYLDIEANLREREELLKAAFRSGYFDDYKETARKGAKLWDAPRRMRKANASPLIPNPVTKSLSGNTTDVLSLVAEKKASLVTFAFSAFGEPHVKSFTDKFLEEFDSEPSVQLVQLNIEENWIKAPVLRLMTPFIRRKVPKERRDRYLMYYASIAESRRAAGMTNSVLGWVNLVDSEGRVRWQAHGPAKPQELNAMIKLTRELAQLDDSTRAIGDATVPPTTAEKEPSSNSADKP